MANALNIDLENQVVIFKQCHLHEPAEEHPYRVTGGFGANPNTHSEALNGVFLSDGERARMGGWMVDRLATDEEIARYEQP